MIPLLKLPFPVGRLLVAAAELGRAHLADPPENQVQVLARLETGFGREASPAQQSAWCPAQS